MSREIDCPRCHGEGIDPLPCAYYICIKCHGLGTLTVKAPDTPSRADLMVRTAQRRESEAA